ncbi:hypothetical protein QFC22_000623 [Naganishia vaughanmartiniae]|uniref:Uncharacterized protein n=1 Tax=Naganishia vaughanmartiniae TaxID=1424756 RepID=A0ACC2XPS9_9TREE|nr:hypothetical protein QFC22_000623 [Naganishia vaughanmartiniae]
MSTKHVAGILGDYTTNDHAQFYATTDFGNGQKSNNSVKIIKSSQTGIVSLLTPPSSDVEAESLPYRLQHSRQQCQELLLETLAPVPDQLSREGTIRKLLKRKEMLEAYLKALAERTQSEVVLSRDLQPALPAATSPQTGQFYWNPRMVRKVTKVNRVRWNMQRLKRRYKRSVGPVAFVNTVSIDVRQQVIQGNFDDSDPDDTEEEIVFKPFRRGLQPEATLTKGLSETVDVPLSPPPKITLDQQRNLLLQTILSPLRLSPTPNVDKSTRKPASRVKHDHVMTSHQLRDLRQKYAIIGENNPVRYPRGPITIPTLRSSSADRDTSDGEVTLAFNETAVILAPPRRPEILDRIEAVAKSLQETFPAQAELLEPFIQDPRTGLSMLHNGAAGIDAGFAQVIWDNGVGTLGMDEETRKIIPAGNVHIFMDHSNVFLSLDATLRENPLPDLPKYKRKILSLPVLSLILQRGRAVHPKGLHLAGSSPLMQSFDPAIKLGWECSILKRVPAGAVMQDLEQGAVDDERPRKQREGSKWHAKPTVHFDLSESTNDNMPDERVSVARHVLSVTSDYETTSCSESEARARTNTRYVKPPCMRVHNKSSTGKPRMKEQAVDELLHLKMLQTILAHRGKRPGTIVLATGDARGGQYNEHGFLGCVREAIARGWQVELWAFKNGMSRSWTDCARREGWLESGRFVVWELDNWIRELTQVVE